MRLDTPFFSSSNQLYTKKPRAIVEIEFDDDDVYRLTSDFDVPLPAGNDDHKHGSFEVISDQSQTVNEDFGSTIGGMTFRAVDTFPGRQLLAFAQNLSDNAWQEVASATTATRTEVGYNGVPNSAWLLTDNSASGEGKFQQVTIREKVRPYLFQCYIGKTQGATTYPVMTLRFSESKSVVIDTNNGVLVDVTGQSPEDKGIEDFNRDFWRVWIRHSSLATDQTVEAYIYPALASALDGSVTALATGSAVFQLPELYEGATQPAASITEKIRSKLLADNKGLREKIVRFKYGYQELAYQDYVTVVTQQLTREVTHDGTTYTFHTEDINREANKEVFTEVKTALAADLPVDETTEVTVYNTQDFSMLEHGNSYTDAPNQTVGYLEIKQGDKREVIRYAGTTPVSFTNITRGVLGTRPQEFTFESGGSDNGITVRQYVYLEMPVLKMIVALLTGDLIGQTGKMPREWHTGIDASKWINLSAFQGFTDLYDTQNDAGGRIARFEDLGRQDGKQFIERQLLPLVSCFMPVQNDGRLGLKRMADVQPNAGFRGILDDTNTVSYGPLTHDLSSVFNRLEIHWNYNANKREFTRINILEDVDSQEAHGETKTKVLQLRGLHGSRHSETILNNLFDSLRDRYAGPPIRHTLQCQHLTNIFEIGDTVRERFPIPDYSNLSTLDRTFEIQRRRIDWMSGKVKFDTFASSQRATLRAPAPDSLIADGFYSVGLNAGNEISATNFPGDVISSGGVTTIVSDIALAGAESSHNAVYWCTEALTVASGVTVWVDKNVQLRVRGFITIDGKIDGVGAAARIGEGYAGASVQSQWGTFVTVLNYFGTQVINLTDYGAATQCVYEVAPFLEIVQDANGITSGIPTDCRGAAHNYPGGPVRRNLFLGGPFEEEATGGASGDAGAGLVIISRGGGFGASGSIDLSGGDASPGGTFTHNGKTYHAGCGAPGGPGTCHWIIDGATSTVPTLALNFVGLYGAIDLNGSEPIAETRARKVSELGDIANVSSSLGADPARRDGKPYEAERADISQACQRVQIVSGFIAPNEDVDSTGPNTEGGVSRALQGLDQFGNVARDVPVVHVTEDSVVQHENEINAGNTQNVADRRSGDIAVSVFKNQLDSIFQEFFGTIAGAAGNNRIVGDVFGGPDGLNLLIDVIQGTIENLAYSGGESVNSLKPAQGGATANTGDLLSDTFRLQSDFFSSGDISNWERIENGDAPIDLVSATSFRPSDSGIFLCMGQFAVDAANSVANTPFIFKIEAYLNGVATGRQIKVGHANGAIATVNETRGFAFTFRAVANDLITFRITKTNATGNVDSSDTFLEILQLKQNPDA